MAKDYYDVLGLPHGAPLEEVKKTYRTLSKELHPDKRKGDKEAERRFKEVNEAYEVLGNPEKKKMYDQFGAAGPGGGGPGFGQGFGGFDFSTFTEGDLDLGDLFGSFFGGSMGRAQRTREERGEDRAVNVEMDLRDVLRGRRERFSAQHFRTCDSCGGSGVEPGASLVTCSVCGGTGQVTRTTRSFFGVIQQRSPCRQCGGSGNIPERPCAQCAGEGRVKNTEAITVEIPGGVQDGQTLRVRGKGEAGRRGAPAGDLYVTVRVRGDSRFTRDGDDIRSTLMLPVTDAILGTQVSVETVHGPVTLKIPEGTQPSQVLRLKGKGLPSLRGGRIGDHYVTVQVEVPEKLSREERKLLEEWRAMQG